MPVSHFLWNYRARVERPMDGDSFHVCIDVGFGFDYRPRHGLRLLDVNTQETDAHDPAIRQQGREAAAFTAAWLAEHAAHLGGDCTAAWPFALHTEKSDSFDRPLSRVECGLGHDLSAALLEAGYPAYTPKK